MYVFFRADNRDSLSRQARKPKKTFYDKLIFELSSSLLKKQWHSQGRERERSKNSSSQRRQSAGCQCVKTCLWAKAFLPPVDTNLACNSDGRVKLTLVGVICSHLEISQYVHHRSSWIPCQRRSLKTETCEHSVCTLITVVRLGYHLNVQEEGQSGTILWDLVMIYENGKAL